MFLQKFTVRRGFNSELDSGLGPGLGLGLGPGLGPGLGLGLGLGLGPGLGLGLGLRLGPGIGFISSKGGSQRFPRPNHVHMKFKDFYSKRSSLLVNHFIDVDGDLADHFIFISKENVSILQVCLE